MGKKSRLKREYREQKQSGIPGGIDREQCVYRFFKDEWEADALERGDIWLSTLERCRSYENPEQGDSEEAQEIYNSGHAVGGSTDLEFVEIARRSGIHIGPGCSNITMMNNVRKSTIPDAYVLCATTEFAPEKLKENFGGYCVKISNPTHFFKTVSKALCRKFAINVAAAGRVIYKDRFFTGLEPQPGPIGFVKPADPYSSQKEFRFLWIPSLKEKITPFLLECPQASHLCERIV